MPSIRSLYHGIAFVVILFITIYFSLVPLLLFIRINPFPSDSLLWPFNLIPWPWPLNLILQMLTSNSEIWYFAYGAFYLLGIIVNLIIGFMAAPPTIFRLLRLRPKEGVYEMNLEEKEFVKWFIGGALFQISFKIANALSFLAKTYVVRAFGGKIGKNSWIVGDVTEPYLFEMGDNSIIAGQSIVNNHVSEHGKLILNYVKIGNNCLIGEKSIVMPGVVLDDNVLVGALSFVPKNRHLTRGIWAGNPVRFIKDISTVENTEAQKKDLIEQEPKF